MTEIKPTFQELLTSQEARDSVVQFRTDKAHGSHWMTQGGVIWPIKHDGENAVWQGWLTEAAPPPEPRVFKAVRYFNAYKVEGIGEAAFATKDEAELCGKMNGGCVGRVRVEITATEGQWDD